MSAADDAIRAAKDPTRTWQSEAVRCESCGGTKEERRMVVIATVVVPIEAPCDSTFHDTTEER